MLKWCNKPRYTVHLSCATTGKNWFELVTASLNHVLTMQNNLCWNPLFSRQIICKQYIVLNHMFFRYENNLKIQIHYILPPFWLNIFHDVSKLTIMQHTHTTQLYLTDRSSLFDQCYESQWKRVGNNMPISPTEPMLKLSLFFLPFQSESTIPDQDNFF